jgi:[ribosomal protein S5]-alanine N-acetyltransferase
MFNSLIYSFYDNIAIHGSIEEQIRMKYKNYILRKAKLNDAKALYDISHDDDVMKYYGESGSYFKSIEDAEKEINWMNHLFENNGARWIIAEKDTNTYIGDIGLFGFDEKNKRVEIGYKLAKKYWGLGITSNFINRVIAWGFENYEYNRIEAIVELGNEGSKKVLSTNKFQFEGVLRDYEFQNSEFIDLEMYSLLRKDWKK